VTRAKSITRGRSSHANLGSHVRVCSVPGCTV
jgi:hypothetical protein